MIKWVLTAFICIICNVFTTLQLVDLSDTIVPAIKYCPSSEIKDLASKFKIPYELAVTIYDVAKREELDPIFLAALIYTESTFRSSTVSSKGYHGYTQIPWRIPYADVNILLGARIFKEKLAIAGGDVKKALILYKGYSLDEPKGKAQAEKVINLYRRLK